MSIISIGSFASLDPQQVSALFQLQQIGQAIAQENQQLASQKKINSAADNPSGSVAVSNLQNELNTLAATSGDLTQATSLVDTAANTAGQIVSQLTQAQTLASAVASGTLSSAQVGADQTQLDQIVNTITSLAGTSFNGTRLLDGSSSYQTVGVNSSQIANVQVLDRQTTSNVAVNVNVTSQATQATNSYSGGTLAAAATVNVTGPSGTAAVSLASGSSTSAIAAAFNSASYLTGVNATAIDANNVSFNSFNYGSAAKISFSTTTGTFNPTTVGTTAGTDAQATINGQALTGNGTTFTTNTNQTTLQVTVSPTASGPLQAFTVTGSGLHFVLGESPGSTVQLGLPALNPASLTGIFGSLTSVASSGSNSLIGGKATQALNIINTALTQATTAQASLGSFEKYTLGSASANVAQTQLNVTSALNAIDGVDVAATTSALANNQLLQQATIDSLQIFNQQRQNLLSLLTGLASKT